MKKALLTDHDLQVPVVLLKDDDLHLNFLHCVFIIGRSTLELVNVFNSCFLKMATAIQNRQDYGGN